jgi:hypothetical protein
MLVRSREDHSLPNMPTFEEFYAGVTGGTRHREIAGEPGDQTAITASQVAARRGCALPCIDYL